MRSRCVERADDDTFIVAESSKVSTQVENVPPHEFPNAHILRDDGIYEVQKGGLVRVDGPADGRAHSSDSRRAYFGTDAGVFEVRPTENVKIGPPVRFSTGPVDNSRPFDALDSCETPRNTDDEEGGKSGGISTGVASISGGMTTLLFFGDSPLRFVAFGVIGRGAFQIIQALFFTGEDADQR